MNIIITNAGSQQIQPTIKALIKNGHQLTGVVRNAMNYPEERFFNGKIRWLTKTNDIRNLAELFSGNDVAVIQTPSVLTPEEMVESLRSELIATQESSIGRVIVIISSVIPDEKVGAKGPDARLEMLKIAKEIRPDALILSSTLYLENFSIALRDALLNGSLLQAIPEDVRVSYLSYENLNRFVQYGISNATLSGLLPMFGPEAWNGVELANFFAKVLGKNVKYKTLTSEEIVGFLANIIGPRVANQVAEMYAFESKEGRKLLDPEVKIKLDLQTNIEWAKTAFPSI